MPDVLSVCDWDELPLMVPLDQSAQTIGISRSTLYTLLKAGELHARRVGGRVFITKAELRRFCEGGGEVA